MLITRKSVILTVVLWLCAVQNVFTIELRSAPSAFSHRNIQSKTVEDQCQQKEQNVVQSYNKKCQFRYSTCKSRPDKVQLLDCTLCAGNDCPYLTYLSEVRCIEQCCPFGGFFLSSMSEDRLQNCLSFTLMQEEAKSWLNNDFFFPFLLVVMGLLIITLVFLLVKTFIHLYRLCVSQDKESQRRNEQENTTQEEEFVYSWREYQEHP